MSRVRRRTGISPACSYQMLVSYLTGAICSLPAAMDRVLLRAGESRDLEELSNISSWSSYQQFKRLLQEASVESDSVPDVLDSYYVMRTRSPEIAQSMHALGSPGAVLATGDGSNPSVPYRRYVMTEVGPTEWTIGEEFIDGFEAYPEFCDFVAWQYAIIPVFFWISTGIGDRGEVSMPRRRGVLVPIQLGRGRPRDVACRCPRDANAKCSRRASSNSRPWSPTLPPTIATRTSFKESFTRRLPLPVPAAHCWLLRSGLGSPERSTAKVLAMPPHRKSRMTYSKVVLVVRASSPST